MPRAAPVNNLFGRLYMQAYVALFRRGHTLGIVVHANTLYSNIIAYSLVQVIRCNTIRRASCMLTGSLVSNSGRAPLGRLKGHLYLLIITCASKLYRDAARADVAAMWQHELMGGA